MQKRGHDVGQKRDQRGHAKKQKTHEVPRKRELDLRTG